jgi:hypothetical protein
LLLCGHVRLHWGVLRPFSLYPDKEMRVRR